MVGPRQQRNVIGTSFALSLCRRRYLVQSSRKVYDNNIGAATRAESPLPLPAMFHVLPRSTFMVGPLPHGHSAVVVLAKWWIGCELHCIYLFAIFVRTKVGRVGESSTLVHMRCSIG